MTKQNQSVSMQGCHRLQFLSLAVWAIIGMMIILVSTHGRGVGLSGDSVGYIAAARSIMSARGIVDESGAPLVSQPPLYPAMLAFAAFILHEDPLYIAGILNSLMFGLLVFLSGWKLMKDTQSISAASICAAAISLSPSMASVAVMAWSETMFILLVAGILFLYGSYFDHPRMGTIVLVGIMTACACLTRYIGVSMIIAGVMSIGIAGPRRYATKLLHCAVMSLIGLIALSIWGLRNIAHSGTWFGERWPAENGMINKASDATFSVIRWINPQGSIASPTGIAVGTACIIFFVSAGIALYRDWASEGAYLPRRLYLASISGLFYLVAYSAVLIITTSVIAQEVDDRMMAPLYVPAVIVSILLGSAAFRIAGIGRSKWIMQGGLAIMLAVVVLPSWIYGARMISLRIRNGAGYYDKDIWSKSSTLRSLKSAGFDRKHPIYSNVPEALYLYAGIVAKPTPKNRPHYYSQSGFRELESYRGVWPAEDGSYLVWFDRVKPRGWQFSIQEIKSIANAVQKKQFEDGTLFTVSRIRHAQ